MPSPVPPPQPKPVSGELYQEIESNPVVVAAEQPVSTFSVDVDTGAYSNMRRFVRSGQLPPKDAVRVEEYLNYFSYGYKPPTDKAVPFAVLADLAPTPWNPDTLLLRVALKGYEIARDKRPPANLVFLVDTSGSMSPQPRLPLAVASLKMLADELREDDRLSIVTYAGDARVALDGAKGSEKERILAALDSLRAAGGTHGAHGIVTAYEIARKHMVKDGANRVLLATDGDFNIGVTDPRALVGMVEERRKSGIALTTLGFGVDNYAEVRLERLADKGNGQYAYIDSLEEARKVLLTELSSTLFTIAKDVKVQVEFNPARIAEYRLIGYENRLLKREEFKDDSVDAGEIGAGHAVTALYEVALVGSKGVRQDPLRYGQARPALPTTFADEIAYLRLRWKKPDEDTGREVAQPIRDGDVHKSVAAAGPDFAFVAAVAAYGQKLRRNPAVATFGYPQIASLAEAGSGGTDPWGLRQQFRSLVDLAKSLDH